MASSIFFIRVEPWPPNLRRVLLGLITNMVYAILNMMSVQFSSTLSFVFSNAGCMGRSCDLQGVLTIDVKNHKSLLLLLNPVGMLSLL